MARKLSPTLVGVFVFGAALLFVAGLAFWGSGRMFERRYRFVCYFPGSVNGLKVGSAVKYRGVPLGEVTGMRIRFEQPESDPRIPVFVEVSGKRLRELGAPKAATSQIAKELIDRGLRARLESESLLTGQLYVNLEWLPDTPAHLLAGGGYPEIPTVATPMEEAITSVTGLLAQLKELDLAGTMRSLSSAIEGVNRLVNKPSVARTLAELPSTVAAVRRLVEDLNAGLGKLGPSLQAMVGARGSLERTLVDVQHAAEAVRQLADFLRRNPNALITGKKRP
jgi:paraquat-inducible protein B